MYILNLTGDDIKTIAFVGCRYRWADWAHRHLSEGTNDLAEHEAWEFCEAIQADTEGNHSQLPMLNPQSELYGKLTAFLDAVV